MKQNNYCVYIFLLILAIGCQPQGHQNNLIRDVLEESKISFEAIAWESIQLTERMEVIDGSLTRNLNYCSHEIKPFRAMDVYDCSFTVAQIQYDLRNKFLFDERGKVASYWSYKAEGPVIHTLEDLTDDPDYLKYIGGDDLKVRVVEGMIIESSDTLWVEHIASKENLLFMKPQKGDKAGKRIIYKYQ
ncbi:MAG: hypothetical protein AAGH79_11185 [Bacteroidota bacterium]